MGMYRDMAKTSEETLGNGGSRADGNLREMSKITAPLLAPLLSTLQRAAPGKACATGFER
jgi:hypothetical protein